MKKLLALACALALTPSLSGCYTLEHTVGRGAQGGHEESERQWFILYGLVPLNEVDSQDLAGDAKDYDVETEQTVSDVLINLLTGFVSIFSRTVTVTR